MNMTKKGFTLIELLGVIIILALLMIIIFPSIINSIKSTNDSIEKDVENLVKNAANLYVDDNADNYIKNEANTYCISIDTLIESGNLDSEIIENSKSITSDYKLEIKYSNATNNFSYNISKDCNEQYQCILQSDANGNGKFDVGDKITCGTESFYVIENNDDEDTIDMLAEYRINLSTKIQNNSIETTNNVIFTDNIAWYDISSKTGIEYGSPKPSYSNTIYYIYDESAPTNIESVTYYVKEYAIKLQEMGISVVETKLMSYEQALNLGCVQYKGSASYYTCGPTWQNADLDGDGQIDFEVGELELDEYAPIWVWYTTYWLGSYTVNQDGEKCVWTIDSDGSFDRNVYTQLGYHGVRPVVTIEKEKIKI